MKYLILFTLFISNSYACLNKINPDELAKVLQANDPSIAESLSYQGEDFVCYDNVDLRFAELIDNLTLDYIAKLDEQSCLDIADCDDKFTKLKCASDAVAINNHDQLQVYCAREVFRIDGKKLVNSAEKKAAYKIVEKLKLDTEKSKKELRASEAEELKTLTISDLSNSAKIAPVLLKIIKRLEAQE